MVITLYVTNLHSVALIDTATNVAESVPIGDLPRQLHISSDGKRAYITDFGHHVSGYGTPSTRRS